MATVTTFVNSVTYGTAPDDPNSMTGPNGYGYATYLIPMLVEVVTDAASVASSAASAYGNAEDAADAAAAAIMAKDLAEAAATAAESWDPANYPRKDSGQSETIAATYTFSQPLYLGSGSSLNFDTGDYVIYDRANNAFQFFIGSSMKLQLNAFGLDNKTSNGSYINSVQQPKITNVYSVAPGGSQALPASPANLDRVQLVLSGNYTASAATFTRNGKLINGLAEDLIVDNINGFEIVELQYSSAAGSWGVA